MNTGWAKLADAVLISALASAAGKGGIVPAVHYLIPQYHLQEEQLKMTHDGTSHPKCSSLQLYDGHRNVSTSCRSKMHGDHKCFLTANNERLQLYLSLVPRGVR